MGSNSLAGSVTAAELAEAATIVAQGGVVAFPTETTYGLAVDPFNPEALAKLFLLKRRPEHKPLLVLVEEVSALAVLASEVPERFQPLMAACWPGPLTLIFPARPGLPRLLTGGTGTVGIRISSHPLARGLGRQLGRPLTATSANLSGWPPATTAAEVSKQLGRGLDYLLDGGATAGGLGSTIVALAGSGVKLIRAGVIPVRRLAQLPGVEFAASGREK